MSTPAICLTSCTGQKLQSTFIFVYPAGEFAGEGLVPVARMTPRRNGPALPISATSLRSMANILGLRPVLRTADRRK